MCHPARAIPTFVSLALIAACSEATAPPEPLRERGAANTSHATTVQSPPTDIRPSGAPTRWDAPWYSMSDEQLEEEVARANGRVFIGFKEADARAGVDDFGRVLASDRTVDVAKEFLRSLGLTLEREYGLIPAVVTTIPPSMAGALRSDPVIDYVEPIFPGEYLGQDTTWSDVRIQAPAAWEYGNGSGTRLLIIDSGIDYTHPDLTPAMMAGCDGSRGTDELGHGTFAAGIAAALDNSAYVIGLSNGVDLWSVRVGAFVPNADAVACAIELGRENGTFSMNMSFKIDPYTPVTDQINAAYYTDYLFLTAAAGNEKGGPVVYPAHLYEVVAVTATDVHDIRYDGAAIGPEIELSAPGVDVKSTTLGGSVGTNTGTSLASPHVAAAVALIRSVQGWDRFEIRMQLRQYAKPIGPSDEYGHGLLQTFDALAGDLSVYINGPRTIVTAGSYTWEANPGEGIPPYSYAWEYCVSGDCSAVGSDKTYSRYVGEGHPDFDLRVTVTSSDDQVAIRQASIAVDMCEIECEEGGG